MWGTVLALSLTSQRVERESHDADHAHLATSTTTVESVDGKKMMMDYV